MLRGWIAHGDVAAVWLTQPLTSSDVVGLSTEPIHISVSQSFEHCVRTAFGFQQVPVDMCDFSLLFRQRFMLFSVNVSVQLKLARRCNNFGHVCSFSGKSASTTRFLFSRSFSSPNTPSSICKVYCSCTCSVVPCQGQLDKQATLVGLNHGQGHRWSGRAVSSRSLS